MSGAATLLAHADGARAQRPGTDPFRVARRLIAREAADVDFDLQRFVDAQSDGVYDQALAEVRAGSKRSHWMWFVFPQIAGLGRSPTAQHYALSGLPEAHAYATHPLLGPRLIESARALTELPHGDAVRVFGPVDAQKLHSSMTLFARAAPDEAVFREVLEKYFGGAEDDGTTSRL